MIVFPEALKPFEERIPSLSEKAFTEPIAFLLSSNLYPGSNSLKKRNTRKSQMTRSGESINSGNSSSLDSRMQYRRGPQLSKFIPFFFWMAFCVLFIYSLRRGNRRKLRMTRSGENKGSGSSLSLDFRMRERRSPAFKICLALLLDFGTQSR